MKDEHFERTKDGVGVSACAAPTAHIEGKLHIWGSKDAENSAGSAKKLVHYNYARLGRKFLLCEDGIPTLLRCDYCGKPICYDEAHVSFNSSYVCFVCSNGRHMWAGYIDKRSVKFLKSLISHSPRMSRIGVERKRLRFRNLREDNHEAVS